MSSKPPTGLLSLLTGSLCLPLSVFAETPAINASGEGVSTWLLLGIGLAGMLVLRRRIQQRNAEPPASGD